MGHSFFRALQIQALYCKPEKGVQSANVNSTCFETVIARPVFCLGPMASVKSRFSFMIDTDLKMTTKNNKQTTTKHTTNKRVSVPMSKLSGHMTHTLFECLSYKKRQQTKYSTLQGIKWLFLWFLCTLFNTNS